jgi:drug/metabolite transporter (DMT)-like permease
VPQKPSVRYQQPPAGYSPLIFVLVATLSLGWGLSWPMMKIALSEFPVWTFRAWSCLGAGLCLLGFARFSGGRFMPEAKEWWGLSLCALCNVTAWHMFIGYGVPLVAAGHAAVLAYTMPLWVVVLGTALFRQPLELPSIAGLIFGLAGISTLLAPDVAKLGEAPLGSGLILLGAISWALGTLIQKGSRMELPILAFSGWQLVLGSLPILFVMPMIEGVVFPKVSVQAWAAGAYITVVALVLCYFLWFKIVSLLPASRASISTLLVPALGVASGALMLGEPNGLREMVALAFTAAALAFVLLVPSRQHAGG